MSYVVVSPRKRGYRVGCVIRCIRVLFGAITAKAVRGWWIFHKLFIFLRDGTKTPTRYNDTQVGNLSLAFKKTEYFFGLVLYF